MTVEEILAEAAKLEDDEILDLFDHLDEAIEQRGLWDSGDEEAEEEVDEEKPEPEADFDDIDFDVEEEDGDDDDADKEGVLV